MAKQPDRPKPPSVADLVEEGIADLEQEQQRRDSRSTPSPAAAAADNAAKKRPGESPNAFVQRRSADLDAERRQERPDASGPPKQD